jgi:hypothetical protein
MKSRVVAPLDGQRVSSQDIRVGKDVIEILTSGMYVSPLSIYREYVQNSADAIDEIRADASTRRAARVSISIDRVDRTIVIRDNGAGIKAGLAVDTLLAIGGSQKRGSLARGFRGVGRLSGLAYCRQLEFVTKAEEDSYAVTLVWDCRKLRELVFGSGADDLRAVIADAVTILTEKTAASEPGFFEVRLRDVARLRNDLLLNERMISEYLAQVAPVPFAPEFSFGMTIEQELRKYLTSAPIELIVAGEEIRRPHRDELPSGNGNHSSRIREIEFFELANVDGETGGIGWLAHHDYVRSLSTGLGVRGIRARVGDIQVGDANLFEESFKEARFNSWTIGEIHMFDRRIVPNARRDNFETNHHYANVLVQVGPVAARISQRCREASVARTTLQTVENLIAEIDDRLKQKTKLDRGELSRLKAAAARAETKAQRLEDKASRDRALLRLARIRKRLTKITPRRGPATVAISEVANLISKLVTNRAQADKLVSAVRKLSN